MNIIFQNKDLDNYYNYNHKDFSINYKGKKILLSKNKDYIKYAYKKLSSWHLKILKNNNEIINYSEISRMTIWQHNNDQLLRFLILQKFCFDKKIPKLNIKNTSIELKIYLKEFKYNYKNNLFSFIDYKLLSFIYLFKLNLINIFGNVKKILSLIYKLQFFNFQSKKLNKKYLSLNQIIIFSYNLSNTSNSYDHYFGKLNKFNMDKVSFIYLDVINKKNNLLNYLSFLDSLKILIKIIIFLFHKFNNIDIKLSKKIILLSPFKIFYLKSLISSNLILEISADIFTKKLFDLNNNIKFISYPFESKPVEFFLNKNSLLNKISIKPYLHAYYYSGHISVNNFQNSNKFNSNFNFLSKDLIQEKYFIDKGYPKNIFQCVGNLRQYKSNYKDIIIPHKLKLLFIVSHGYELSFFVDWLSFNLKLLNKFEITIKPYPFAWYNEQSNALKRLDDLIKYKINDNFSNAINKNNIILFGITSAGFELIHTNKLIYHLNIDEKNFINLFSEYSYMKNFNSSRNMSEFKYFLENINDRKYFDKLLNNQKKFYKYINQKTLTNPFDI